MALNTYGIEHFLMLLSDTTAL